MTFKLKTFLLSITVLISILTMSMISSKTNDDDYQRAISIAEKNFSSFNIKRVDYKLIKIENDIINSSETWKFTYLDKNCISKEGVRNCRGGEVFITVNIKTKKTTIGWGE